jgi:hypothetical protein
MLGMIFGVAAVIAMLSIGAGAQQQMIAFIQQLGVRNIIVEARESTDETALSKTVSSRRPVVRDVRMIQASLQGIKAVTARKADHAGEAAAQALRRHTCRLWRRADLSGHRQPEPGRRPLLFGRRSAVGRLRRGVGSSRGGRILRIGRSRRPVRQGQRHLVSHRRRRAAPTGGSR